MQEILWSEKYEFSVGPLFLRDCMLEQASLIDSGFFGARVGADVTSQKQ